MSGNRAKQPRNDPSRVSSGRTPAPNRIPRFRQSPYLPSNSSFRPTVAFNTHRNSRDRDSLAFRTAGPIWVLIDMMAIAERERIVRDMSTVQDREVNPGHAVAIASTLDRNQTAEMGLE